MAVGMGILALFAAFATLSVGWEVAERRLFAGLPIGWHHAILTTWAGLIAGVACAAVYIPMRRQHQRLSATAEELTRLLDRYQADPTAPCRFENPHLVHCRDVIHCDEPTCAMYTDRDARCWQIMALQRAHGDHVPPRIEIQHCLQCAVYRLSCPDKLTELGESFNNLIFLLQKGNEQFGRLQAQMIEKGKMAAIGQIAAGVAHEVGNPLSSISSIVQMLKRNKSCQAMIEQLELIERHIKRISVIVRQLVTMARPAAERWDRIDVGPILEEAVRLIAFDRRARNVEIDYETPANLPLTWGIRGELQQVFINLALNALDAMPDCGTLKIHTEGNTRCITVWFEDTGCGISPESGRRVFEPFYTTKEPGHGTGLGLSVSYGIVQKHGGTIDFTSVVGQGTVFTVQIPVLKQPLVGNNGPSHHTAGGR
jgi:signal transduction histidine kinase